MVNGNRVNNKLQIAVASCLLLFAALVSDASAKDAFCFNAGSQHGWDCNLSRPADLAFDNEYHTLKITLDKQQDDTRLQKVLPIERIGEVPLPGGERVVFLGRFRDSMKAFRVVEKCRETYAADCAEFSPKVVRIGFSDGREVAAGDTGTVAAVDLQKKAAGDLFGIKTAALDFSGDAIGEVIGGLLGTPQPRGLLKLPSNVRHLLWVDLKEGNLHVLARERDQYKIAETMSVSIGKHGFGKMKQGDKKTPVGVYRLMSELDDEQLDDFYGRGAFTLNYPNNLDKIRQRDGSGIWLHGLPKGRKHRPLQDSDGCVVLSNDMLAGIAEYIDVQRTPIVLDDGFSWVSGSENEAERIELEQAIEAWRSAWSAIDNERYLGFYTRDFTNFEKDLDAWKRYKTRIHKHKRYIDVSISDLSLLAYPGEQNMALARFYQKYSSSNFRSAGWKEQLWRKEDDGKWRIVFERG